MPALQIHHVSVITRDLDRAARFYEEVLGFTRIPRPPFATAGIWYGLGALQVHVILYPAGTYRSKAVVDNDDVHFALRSDDFEATVEHLSRKGYSPDLPEGDPRRIMVKRTGLAGFPQLYLMDPDNHLIEINQAPLG